MGLPCFHFIVLIWKVYYCQQWIEFKMLTIHFITLWCLIMWRMLIWFWGAMKARSVPIIMGIWRGKQFSHAWLAHQMVMLEFAQLAACPVMMAMRYFDNLILTVLRKGFYGPKKEIHRDSYQNPWFCDDKYYYDDRCFRN